MPCQGSLNARAATKTCFHPNGTKNTIGVAACSSAKSQRGNSLAVVMGGQPRSFVSSLMREYWRLLFLNLKQQMEVVLFAVLSRKSTNTKSKTEASIFTTEQLQHILAGIDVTWRAAT